MHFACAKDEPALPPPASCAASDDTRATAEGALHLTNGCGEAHLVDLVVDGDGPMRVELYTDGESVLPAVVAEGPGAVFRGLRWTGSFALEGAEPVAHWKQGFQSWSSSGVFEPGDPVRGTDGLPLVGGDGVDTLGENAWSSWWGGLVGRADGGSLLIGVESAARTRFSVAFDGDVVHALWGGRGEAIDVLPGTTLFLDRLGVRIGPDPNQILAAWAEEVAALAQADDSAVEAPLGWSSWTVYYDDIGEDAVADELAASTLPPGSVFQVDDGWQVAWGDWRANDRFPGGSAGLARQIADAGYVPGLWLAPFLVDRAAPGYLENPTWWVRDAQGVELDVVGHAVLDVTADGAEAWMVAAVADRVAEGFLFLKLDYLFAGSLEGVRSEPVTGIEAYVRGLDALRAATDGAFLLACGAPMLPTVGRADAWRSGADIAFALDPDPRLASVRSQARQTAARAFTARWWHLDPDSVLVRAPLTDDEATGSVAAAALAGGSWLLGDSFLGADPARAALASAPSVVSRRAGPAVPRDPLRSVSGFDVGPPVEWVQQDDAVPAVWDFADGRTVLLNLGVADLSVVGPGGVELLRGATSGAGERVLRPGVGEIWTPVPGGDGD